MPRVPKSPGVQGQRHNPLAEEYLPSDPYKNKVKRTKRNRSEDDNEQGYVDSKSSRKILEIGRELEEEDERENHKGAPKAANPAFDFESRIGEEDLDEHVEGQFDDDEEAWGEEEEEVEEVEIDANDLAAWNKFIPTDDNPIQWPGAEAAPSGPGRPRRRRRSGDPRAADGRTARTRCAGWRCPPAGPPAAWSARSGRSAGRWWGSRSDPTGWRDSQDRT